MRTLPFSPRCAHSAALAGVLGLTLAILGPIPGVAAADGESHAAGYVYVLDNGASNAITTYARGADGSLTPVGTTETGGAGSVPAFADGTEGSLIRARDGSPWLFAADAGSDQVSVLAAQDGQLTLKGVFAAGGAGPVSLTYGHGRLYVLNAANGREPSANVAGFRVGADGQLRPIAGATRPLSTAHPNPAQIQIDPSGRWVVVTEKLTNRLDVFRVGADGGLSTATSVPSTGLYPFGMAFDPARPRELIVDDGFGTGVGITGAVTAYRLADGGLRVVSGPVPDFQIAPCWMVVTGNGRFAYTSNADSQTISGFAIAGSGALSLLTANGATATTPGDTFPLEEGLSRGSRYLYVLDSRLLLKPLPGPATLSGFRVHEDGSLTPVIDPAGFTLPFSAIGLAAE